MEPFLAVKPNAKKKKGGGGSVTRPRRERLQNIGYVASNESCHS